MGDGNSHGVPDLAGWFKGQSLHVNGHAYRLDLYAGTCPGRDVMISIQNSAKDISLDECIEITPEEALKFADKVKELALLVMVRGVLRD